MSRNHINSVSYSVLLYENASGMHLYSVSNFNPSLIAPLPVPLPEMRRRVEIATLMPCAPALARSVTEDEVVAGDDVAVGEDVDVVGRVGVGALVDGEGALLLGLQLRGAHGELEPGVVPLLEVRARD